MTENELVDEMAQASFEVFCGRPGAWTRAKDRTKEQFRAEARAILQVLRLHGLLRQLSN